MQPLTHVLQISSARQIFLIPSGHGAPKTVCPVSDRQGGL